MNESAQIRNDQALSDLKQALHRFEHDIQSAITDSQGEIARTQANIEQQVRHWQGQVQRADLEYRQAQTALHFCRTRNASRPTSCINQEDAVDIAATRLIEAKRQLDRTKQWKLSIEAAAHEYRRHAARLNNLANNHSPQTRAFLDRAIADLERYLATTSSGEAPSSDIPILSPIAQTIVAPLPGDEPAAESSKGSSYKPEKDEVFWCGSCNRQQGAEEGEKCKICSKLTVSWYLDRESEADVRRKWERINPSHGL